MKYLSHSSNSVTSSSLTRLTERGASGILNSRALSIFLFNRSVDWFLLVHAIIFAKHPLIKDEFNVTSKAFIARSYRKVNRVVGDAEFNKYVILIPKVNFIKRIRYISVNRRQTRRHYEAQQQIDIAISYTTSILSIPISRKTTDNKKHQCMH